MVERFNTSKVERPKTSQEVIQETSSEVSDLKFEVKNQAKFESLLQDPVLQWAFEKLGKQMSEKTFWKEWEKLGNVNVSNKLKIYEKKNPGLNLYIKSLWLENAGNFKTLTTEQKIKYAALNEAIKTEKNAENIIKKSKEIEEKYAKKMENNFTKKHLTNFLQLKETLKDYWLNDQEIKKFQELVDLIDKWETLKKKFYADLHLWGAPRGALTVMPATIERWLLVGALVVWFIIWWLTVYIVMSNKDKNKPRKRIESFTRTWSMKEVSEWVTYKDDLYSYEHWELKMCEIDEEWNFIQRARNAVKSGVNYFQNRKIDMIVEWTVQIKFPLENEGKVIEHYDADTWTFTVDLYFPEEPVLDVVNVSTKVLNESTEAVRMDEWKNFQSELMVQWIEAIKQQAIKDWIVEKWQETMIRKATEHYKWILDLIANNETWYKLVVNVHYMNELPQEFQSIPQDSLKVPQPKG